MKIKKNLLNLRKYIYSNKLLVLILIVAGLFRIIGFYPGYHPYHSDEGMSYASAIYMIKTFSLDPGRYDYPTLVPLIHAILYLFVLPFALVLNFIYAPENIRSSKDLFELVGRFLVVNQQTQVLFWGRFITAIFGIGVVFLTYLLSISFFNSKKIGLISAFLVAVNYRQVLNSHLGLPDIYNSFFLMVSLIITANLIKKSSLKNYLLASIAIALSFSTKFQIFALFPLVTTHFYISFIGANKNINRIIQNLFSLKLLISGLTALVIVLVLHVFYFIHWEEFREINSYNLLKYSFGLQHINYYAISYIYHIGIGPLISILILGGILLGIVKKILPTALFLSVIIPFLYIFLYYSNGGYYTRNFITIIPTLLIFAGYFLTTFVDRLIKSKLLNTFLIILSLLIVNYANIINSYYVISNYSKPWNLVLARDFADKYIPNNSKVLSHPWDQYPRNKNFEIVPFESNSIFTISELIDEGVEYAFINIDWLSIKSNWWVNRDPVEFLGFWEKPVPLLRNTNATAVSQELASYSIQAFVKNWQAPDMNFIVIKVPKRLEIKRKKILAEFHFNNKEETDEWYLADSDINPNGYLEFDEKEGYLLNGSLKLDNKVSLFQSKRAVSKAIAINPNKAYVIEGYIKSSGDVAKDRRDGMIRVDFYKKNPGKITTQTPYLYSSVSSRYFGEGWQKVELVVVPPEESKYMTLNLEQAGNIEYLLFEDILVSESVEDITNPRKLPPYIDYQIPDDILFPYSQGGL